MRQLLYYPIFILCLYSCNESFEFSENEKICITGTLLKEDGTPWSNIPVRLYAYYYGGFKGTYFAKGDTIEIIPLTEDITDENGKFLAFSNKGDNNSLYFININNSFNPFDNQAMIKEYTIDQYGKNIFLHDSFFNDFKYEFNSNNTFKNPVKLKLNIELKKNSSVFIKLRNESDVNYESIRSIFEDNYFIEFRESISESTSHDYYFERDTKLKIFYNFSSGFSGSESVMIDLVDDVNVITIKN